MREPVTDVTDPRLADYARLTDMELRTHLESAQGLFIAEGTKVITRAVAAGYPVRSILLAERRLGDLEALPATGAPVYVVSDETAERLTGYRVHRGALASLHRKPLPEVPALAAAARKVIVLEDLVDHANVGAIFRCAAALGVDAILLSPRCADPLYRRAVKVSMGAVFAIPYARMTGWYDGLADLRKAGFRLLALTPDATAVPLSAAAAGERNAERTAPRNAQRVALMLGTEGDGLSSRWLHEADQAVRIPMHPGARAAGVDSLNVVAAAAIACHVLAGGDETRSVG
jgi:tRNA G18 (ribose-2'-O)-methylase SpoU